MGSAWTQSIAADHSLAVHATLAAEFRKEIGRIPLPGGFTIKDVRGAAMAYAH